MDGGGEHGPVTYERCEHVTGPFFHGTRAVLAAGEELLPGYGSNYQPGRVMNHVYFSAVLETAVWGAELASALAPDGDPAPDRGRIYLVEPLGPFEDDPNVTDKRFPGNPTRSYRTRHPLRVVEEVGDWEGHPPEVLADMLERLARLREQGLDVIED
jgi:rifampin ADP-ribosylating transferase